PESARSSTSSTRPAISPLGVTQYDKLPVNARLYLQRIEQVTGVPIAMISTSPDRDHTIMMRHPYLAD
ncbi:MAG: adenylosuccinate synthetase, partial [Pseudacidovorax sp.]|nr:adenylosuccinate synthetase [Pseudacidovorax sp.]